MNLPISDKFSELSPDEVVNEAIKSYREGKCVFLTDKNRSHIPLRSLLSERNHPEKTKLKGLAHGTHFISKDEDPEDIAEVITNNGLDFMPIEEDGSIVGVVLEEDLAKELSKSDLVANKTLEDIMTPGPFCVSESDDIATARNMMFEENIERMPVVDESGKVTGVVTIQDIINTARPDEKQGRGDKSGKHESEEMAPVRDVMRKDFVTASPEDIVKNAFEKFEGHIIVTEDGIPFGIVTAKDLLEFFPGPEEEGVYVNVMGLQEVDDFIKVKVHKEIENSVKKIGKMITLLNVFIHVKFHKEGGDRTKYSVRVRADSDEGFFVSKDWGWDLIDVMSNALDKFEREVIKQKEKERDRERRPSKDQGTV